jgi:hypothetical protein
LYFPWSLLILLRLDSPSTGDEVAVGERLRVVRVDYVDPWTGPSYASIKIFYRPGGKLVVLVLNPLPMFFPELLSAQGVIIPLNEVERLESPIENKHAKEEDGSPGPSGSGSGPKIKKEELSELEVIMIVKRIQAFQVSQGVVSVRFLGISPDELACRMT